MPRRLATESPEQTTVPEPGPTGLLKDRVQVIRVPSLSAIEWALHGFSTRTGGKSRIYRPSQQDGDLNLGFTEADDRDRVVANRERFLSAVTGDVYFPMVTLQQIHSSVVCEVTRADVTDGAFAAGCTQADGMMTSDPGILLAIQTADCIPVLVADRKRRAVAGFHAGWRGTAKRIVENGVARMRLAFGSRPEDLIAAIGPGIGPCCYEIGEEVFGEFNQQFSYAPELFSEAYDTDPVKSGHSKPVPRLHLDLAEANRRQLLDAGLKADAIAVVGDCTGCQTERYFSYRAEHGLTGRMLSVIGIRS